MLDIALAAYIVVVGHISTGKTPFVIDATCDRVSNRGFDRPKGASVFLEYRILAMGAYALHFPISLVK